MMKLKLTEHGNTMETEYGELTVSPDSSYGFRPYQLMIASIAGCSSSALRVVMNKMRIEFTDIEITVEIERNKEEANRIEKMHLHFTVIGENLRKEKIEKAGVVARKNCSMVRSVEGSIEIIESYDIKN